MQVVVGRHDASILPGSGGSRQRRRPRSGSGLRNGIRGGQPAQRSERGRREYPPLPPRSSDRGQLACFAPPADEIRAVAGALCNQRHRDVAISHGLAPTARPRDRPRRIGVVADGADAPPPANSDPPGRSSPGRQLCRRRRGEQLEAAISLRMQFKPIVADCAIGGEVSFGSPHPRRTISQVRIRFDCESGGLVRFNIARSGLLRRMKAWVNPIVYETGVVDYFAARAS